MSAFIVQDETINVILAAVEQAANGNRAYDGVQWAAREFLKEHAPAARDLAQQKGLPDLDALGCSIFALNVRAVEERYGVGEAVKFRPLDCRYRPTMAPPPIGAYKALGCLLYQCSEGNVPQEPLYKALESLYDAMAHAIVQALPAYDKAPYWG